MLQRAAEDAVTPEHVAAIMRRALRSALEGNLAAARFVVERVCGRAPEAHADALALDIAPPKLRTAADCAAALQRVSDAVCAGAIDLGTAKVLTDLIQTQAKLIEVGDLEGRLAELEQQAKSVDLGGNRSWKG